MMPKSICPICQSSIGQCIVETIAMERQAPSPPTDITIKAISSSSIMVSWSPPAHTNGPLEPYRAHCTKVGENWPRSATTKDNATTSVEVRGLRPNTNYECYVEAGTKPLITQWGDSLTSTSTRSTPVKTWPGTLQGLVVKDVVAVDANSLDVFWYEPQTVEGILGGFTISVGLYIPDSVNEPDWRHVANVTADSRSYRITDLEPDTHYEVTVRGYVLPNEEGHGGGYSQYSYPRSASTLSAVAVNTFTHSFVGLKPYTRIFAAVRAATAANERGQGGGIGQISPTKQITTMEAAPSLTLPTPTAPGPVGDLTCAQDPAGSSRLVCRWQEPVNKNGLIRNYKIKLVDKHDSDRVVFEGDSTNPATTIERNLNFDHTFSLSVSAVTIEEGPVLTIQVKLTEATHMSQRPSHLQSRQFMHSCGHIFRVTLTTRIISHSPLLKWLTLAESVSNQHQSQPRRSRQTRRHTSLFLPFCSPGHVKSHQSVSLYSVSHTSHPNQLPSAVVEVITQHLLSPPPSSLPVSDNTTECNIYLKLSAIDFTQYSPVSHVGVLVEEESAGASAKTSDGMPYYAYAQGLSKSWEVIAISRTGGVSQNMDDYVFTLGANKRPIQPDNSFNGPLKPSTDYVVEIRFHNKAGYTETSGVNIRTSSKVDTGKLLQPRVSVVMRIIEQPHLV
ncbi:unnamed protein product [Mesocestoides corti]|uniref:Fibronectin type-III domain-containing protein n=1 Tax=Mesocestoides corti TaxID=53468 RepID=A0A0R3UR42_MESCO|nr:unnamed protein product [Mesocestoides corti]